MPDPPTPADRDPVSAARERRLLEVVQEAGRLQRDERESYLAEACGGDTVLLELVRGSLASDSDPAAVSPAEPARAGIGFAGGLEPDLLGTRVGAIRLLDVLGEGGMGKVYLGRDEKLERKVAVKCILARHSMSAEVKARFLQEARILSRLRHPGICQIHDYVEGEESDFLILEYIDDRTLQQAIEAGIGKRQKMRIAMALADVLVAAHAQNVVHRDLKPGNVMLDREGEVKVLDFGLARSLDEPQTTRLLSEIRAAGEDSTVELARDLGAIKTEPGLVIGTPEYMSPEQARQEAVTPASDMYSFGLILHRLFTGRSPYGEGLHFFTLVRKAAAAETLPVEGVDRELAALIGRLTSLAPGARPSAVDAAERLRWIRDAPARKRIRRWKVAAVAALALIAAVMTFQSLRIRQEADHAGRAAEQARQEATTTREVLEFLVSLFEVSDPGEARGNEVTAREILDRGAGRISRELVDQPLIRARLLDSMGVIYRKLGLLKASEPLLEEALSTRRSALGGEDPQVAESLVHLAFLRMLQGRLDEADRLSGEALAIRQRTRGADHEEVAESLDQRAHLFAQQGNFEAAEPLYQRALAIQEQRFGDESREVARTLAALALLYEQQGEFRQAEKLHLRALEIREKLGPDHPELAESLNGLAIVYDQQGEPERARPLWERALAISEKIYDPGHPQIGMLRMNLATVHAKMGELATAETLYLQALESFEKVFGPDHPRIAEASGNLANLHLQRGRFAEGESLFRRARSIFERVLGPEHPAVAMCLGGVGGSFQARRRYAEAEPHYQRALAIFERALGAEHPEVARTLNFLAALYARTGRPEEARSASRRARAIAEKALGPDHRDAAFYLATFADIERRSGALAEAEAHLLQARAALEASLQGDDPKLVRPLLNLANVYRDQGDLDRAEPLYERCAEILKNAHGEEHPAFVELYEDRAELLRAAGRSAEAGRLEARARELAREFGVADRPRG